MCPDSMGANHSTTIVDSEPEQVTAIQSFDLSHSAHRNLSYWKSRTLCRTVYIRNKIFTKPYILQPINSNTIVSWNVPNTQSRKSFDNGITINTPIITMSSPYIKILSESNDWKLIKKNSRPLRVHRLQKAFQPNSYTIPPIFECRKCWLFPLSS